MCKTQLNTSSVNYICKKCGSKGQLSTVKLSKDCASFHNKHIANAYVLKGQSNEIFDPQFFLSFEPAWATD